MFPIKGLIFWRKFNKTVKAFVQYTATRLSKQTKQTKSTLPLPLTQDTIILTPVYQSRTSFTLLNGSYTFSEVYQDTYSYYSGLSHYSLTPCFNQSLIFKDMRHIYSTDDPLHHTDDTSSFFTDNFEKSHLIHFNTAADTGKQDAEGVSLSMTQKLKETSDNDENLKLYYATPTKTIDYNVSLAIGRDCCGRWKTVPERSESLDPHYRALGLGTFKRQIMNRIAVCLTLFLEENDTILHSWIHTPLGIRHMRNNLLGDEVEDDDADLGRWKGITRVATKQVQGFNENLPFLALEQTRTNEKKGVCVETRAVIDDKVEGKIMYFHIELFPASQSKNSSLKATRILRPILNEKTY